MVVVVGALLLSVAAGVAVAETFVCDSKPCYGTNDKDQIGERNGSVSDRIFAKGEDDQVNASRAGNDKDVVFGQSGNDTINVADGDDRDKPNCGSGNDDTAIVDFLAEASYAQQHGCENIII